MHKKLDLVLILIWPVFASLISFAVNAGLVVSMLFFLGAPSLYLSFRYPRFIKRIALFSLVLSVPTAIITDRVMEQTGGWRTYSIFGSFRLLNYVIADQIVWLFIYVYFVGIFYEAFLDSHKEEEQINPRLWPLAIFMGLILLVFVLAHFFSPALLTINYFYLKFGLIFGLLPILLGLFKIPKVYGKIFRAGVYFIFLSFIYELTALSLGQWSFPAKNQFVGSVQVLGTIFPIEELFFWIFFGAIAALSYFEFFADDQK